MHFSAPITAAILAFSPVAMAATQTVQVGQNNALTFAPNTVQMNVGDQLVFQFDNANHTATMSNASPNSACVANNQAFSGYMPINKNTPNPTGANPPSSKKIRGMNNVFEARQNGAATFTYTATTPGTNMWFCSAAAHCQNGMVLAVQVNPAGTTTNKRATTNLQTQLQQYIAAARKVKTNGQANVPAGTGGTLSATAIQLQKQNKNANAGTTTTSSSTTKAGAKTGKNGN